MSSYQDTLLSISGAVVFQQGCTYWAQDYYQKSIRKRKDIKNCF